MRGRLGRLWVTPLSSPHHGPRSQGQIQGQNSHTPAVQPRPHRSLWGAGQRGLCWPGKSAGHSEGSDRRTALKARSKETRDAQHTAGPSEKSGEEGGAGMHLKLGTACSLPGSQAPSCPWLHLFPGLPGRGWLTSWALTLTSSRCLSHSFSSLCSQCSPDPLHSLAGRRLPEGHLPPQPKGKHGCRCGSQPVGQAAAQT